MKINARLLLLTFTIVVIITVSSTIVYFSLTNKIITTQQNQSILNSTNDFIFNFQLTVEEIENSFNRIVRSQQPNYRIENESPHLDFIFTLINDSQIDFNSFSGSKNLNVRSKNLTLMQFLSDNPNIILKYDVREENTYYYGKVITEKLLNEISEKIRANISLVVNNTPVEMTKSGVNQVYLPALLDAIEYLKYKNRFDIYSGNYESYDFYATLYVPSSLLAKDYKLGFIIYNPPKEVQEFRSNTGLIAIIITTSGIALALILVLLFTSKLRVQISNLSYAAEIIGQGNLDHRVPVDSKDELGKLGIAFNKMLDELKAQKEAEKEYTEFITLLNQQPKLHEIADAAIQKIVKATGISFGVLYLVEGKDRLRKIASHGISIGVSESNNNFDYYRNAIDQKDIIEFKFKKNLPVIKTGIAEIRIKYTLIIPIIYGNDVVAVIELASEEIPEKEIKSYLINIREQLAIGIINGAAVERLEELVENLKKLNIEYENQNKELRELHHELKIKADELNLERIKALESTKLKSQFLTNITHELKTPLNSIIGLSDLISKDELLIDTHKNRLNVIIRNGKKLLNLINNILEFSKAEAGKTIIKNEKFELHQFIEDLNSFVQPLVIEKGLNYICEVPKKSSVILFTDKSKLEQILINLLNNAIKFTDEGVIKLFISIESMHSLKIEVSDTGIGIDENDSKIIFEEFRQADGSISRQHDGTGLGLSICKRFAELLNGKFSLESEVGVGSKFTVLLPNVIQSDLESYQLNESDIQLIKRILILEENKTDKKLIGDYLLLNDFQIIEYDNNSSLISFIKQNYISTVIINQNYNNNQGWEILKSIKSSNEVKNVKVIMVSTFNEKNYGYGLAVYDYINYDQLKYSSERYIKKLSLETDNKLPKIISLLKDDELKQTIANVQNVKSISQNNFINNVSGSFDGSQPDFVFLELDRKSIEIIDIIKHERSTRKIQFVLVFNNESETREIVNQLNKYTLNRKHHVIDVLKIIRDRLKIAENELAKAKLLIDETIPSVQKEIEVNTINNVKVLIVDDDKDTLFTVGEIVQSLGYNPLFAKNGVECILTLKHEVPDLILLDIMMPKMDGFETLKEIRKHNEYKNIPVVALTAYAMLDDKDIIDKSGFDDIITKPIDILAITSKLNKLFVNRI
ncbi:MAG: response regulator [Melioribacteraceae bacterium]|nr:response regulator [Melioribacteraceae bacterium]